MSAPSGWFWYGSIFIWVLIGIVLQKLNFKRYRKTSEAFWFLLFVNILSSVILYFYAIYLDVQIILSWKYFVLVGSLTALEVTIYMLYFNFVRKKEAFEIEQQEMEAYHDDAQVKFEDCVPVIAAFTDSVFETFRNDPIHEPYQWCEKHCPQLGQKANSSAIPTPTNG